MSFRFRHSSGILAIFWLAFAIQVSAQSVLHGRVLTDEAKPIAYVNVQIVGTVEGATTNRAGTFRIVTDLVGQHTLQISLIGMETVRKSVSLPASDSLRFEIVLREALIELDEAVATASSYATGEVAEATLETLEVATTPGAAADLFLAMKTLPGVAMVDEGAGLFVRGGDVDETVLLLDQATVLHPYKYESPTGGAMGTISPFLIGGTYFSTGGFSARYGNALSGVLVMESLGMPEQRRIDLGLGLAAASVGFSSPILSDKLGIRLSGNRSFTGAMFRLNGQAGAFSTVPQGYDGNLSLHYRYRPTGELKFFNFINSDAIGVPVREPSFSAEYSSETRSTMHNLQWTEVFGSWLVQSSASVSTYRARQTFGVVDLEPGDAIFKFRGDAERSISEGLSVRVGAEWEHLSNTLKGRVPARDNLLDPTSPYFELDEAYRLTRRGAYVETTIKLNRRLVGIAGLRSDLHYDADVTFDPRISLQYALGKATDLRVAWGLYHQAPAPYDLNPVSGNPDLTPRSAQHAIVGVSHEKDLLQWRIEAYRKTYGDLIVQDQDLRLDNAGRGKAIGLDAFLKYGAFLRTRVNGWLAYSYLRSDRTQVRHLGPTFVREYGPSPFDITHNLTIVGKTRVYDFWTLGLTLRTATGRPLTPITGGVRPSDSADYYVPVEGPVGSERLPIFFRVDLNLSYYLPLGSRGNAVFYAAMSNASGRANVLDYTYNEDFSSRSERISNYGRLLYFGVTVSLN